MPVTQSQKAVTADATKRLAPEILASVFDYMADARLHDLAAVSSRWMAVARKHPRYYLHQAVTCSSSQGLYASDIASLKEMVAYGALHDLALSVMVWCHGNFSPTMTFPKQTDNMLCDDLASSLRAALPHLVKLQLFVPMQLHDMLFAAICTPAPRLRECTLGAASPYDTPPLRGVPRDVFGGTAPLLRSLTFVGLSPDAENLGPLSVFSCVPGISFRYEGVWPKLLLKSYFPKLRSLGISWETSSATSPISVLPLDCTGLTLKDLFIFDCQCNPIMPHLAKQLRLKDIPVIRMGMPWDGISYMMMDDLHAPLSLHALSSGEHSASFCTVTTHDGRRRIFAHYGWYQSTGHPLCDLRVLAGHLTHIRIESDFIPGLVAFDAELPVLVELRIDLSREENAGGFRLSERFALWHSSRRLSQEDDEGGQYSSISCRSPKLERLVVFSLDGEEQVLGADLRDIGLLLGQAERSTPARLVMVGVRFKDDIDQLDSFYAVFSEVLYKDFHGRTCPDSDYDEFWKYGFSSS